MERIKSLLLLGGSAPAGAMQLARHRRADLDVTLVTPWSYKTSAAMAAGYVAGEHPLAACQIDLEPLVKQAGVRWISARCSGLDANTSSVMLDYGASGATVMGQRTSSMVGRPAVLTCDYLSIDTGTVMERRQLDSALPGAADHALLYKPTEQFINRWTQTVNQARSRSGTPLSVCVIGADTVGVVLCFAIRHGLKKVGIPHQIHLLTHGQALAEDQTTGVRKRVAALLKNTVWQWCLNDACASKHKEWSWTTAPPWPPTPWCWPLATNHLTGWHTADWQWTRPAALRSTPTCKSTSHPRVFAGRGVRAGTGQRQVSTTAGSWTRPWG